tara:strand:- start:69 stop:494 length:426 start_codon:yes stop_codon:yes gene_type:complete
MARRKSTRRRTRRSFSIINALESLTYAEILSRGITGTGVFGFFTGDTDLAMKTTGVSTQFFDNTSMVISGQDEISLGDLLSNPSLAVGEMANNLSSNIVPMAVGAATTAITFNVGKRLLRRPINNINRNLMKPLLGAGIKL